MALVAYDSDCSYNSEDEETPTASKTADAAKSDNLFGSLPVPKIANTRSLNVEEDDEFLKKKEVPTEKPPTRLQNPKIGPRKPTLIYLPSLSSFEDEESEPKPRFKQPSKATGLLSMLPEPKSEMFIRKPSTSFLPNILNKTATKPTAKKPAAKSTNKSNILINSYNSSDDSDISDSEDKPADFFSLSKDLNSVNVPSQSEVVDVIDPVPKTIIEDLRSDTNSEYYQQETIPSDPPQISETFSYSDTLDDEALLKLSSSRERRKGESIQIIDINQKEIMPDSKAWLTKALTENAPTKISSGKRRSDDFTSQQRRKHQITYLAHQARANEQELQNQWAQNRLTKKQTQSKYGF